MSTTFFTDIANVAQGDASIRPQAALTASANGGGIDLQLSSGPIHAIICAGATDFTSGDETYVVKLQESSDNSTFTDISGASVSITAQNTTVYISTNQRMKRYVRAVITIAGTTPSALVSVYVFSRKEIVGSGSGNALTSTPGAGF